MSSHFSTLSLLTQSPSQIHVPSTNLSRSVKGVKTETFNIQFDTKHKIQFDKKNWKISKFTTDPSRELGVAMAHTTASMKTHTGHGHHDVGRQEVGRHTKDRQSTSKQERQSKHLSAGITTPTPVQQSSEVSIYKNLQKRCQDCSRPHIQTESG